MVDEQEHLADPLDQATRFTRMETDFLIADSVARAAPKQVQVKDDFGHLYWPSTECDTCGEELEPHRLPMCRCVPCQHAAEVREKSYAHL